MTNIITIDSLSFYIWVFLLSCLLNVYMFGLYKKTKKRLKYNNENQDRIIKPLNDSILSPEKETLSKIIEILLYEDIEESLKMGFIKDAIKDYLKEEMGEIEL